jgi:hypothetical protein
MSLEELQAQCLDVLPDRHTMAVVSIDDVKLLNKVKLLKGNDIAVIANVLSSHNWNKIKQK